MAATSGRCYRRFTLPAGEVSVGVWPLRDGGRVIWAALVLVTGPHTGARNPVLPAWHTRDPGGVALCRAVAGGDCPPGVLGDWIADAAGGRSAGPAARACEYLWAWRPD